MARHSSEHASSCTEEREKEELAVRQRVQKVFDVAELNKPESSEDVGTIAIELHEINQMTTQQQQSTEDLDCENNDDSVHPYLPNIYKPPINDTGKSILLLFKGLDRDISSFFGKYLVGTQFRGFGETLFRGVLF